MVTDLSSPDQLVTLAAAIEVITLKELFLHKHVPQRLLQSTHTSHGHCQVQKVFLRSRQNKVKGIKAN